MSTVWGVVLGLGLPVVFVMVMVAVTRRRVGAYLARREKVKQMPGLVWREPEPAGLESVLDEQALGGLAEVFAFLRGDYHYQVLLKSQKDHREKALSGDPGGRLVEWGLDRLFSEVGSGFWEMQYPDIEPLVRVWEQWMDLSGGMLLFVVQPVKDRKLGMFELVAESDPKRFGFGVGERELGLGAWLAHQRRDIVLICITLAGVIVMTRVDSKFPVDRVLSVKWERPL